MNRHAGPPAGAPASDTPEPSYAERARTLAFLGRTGTLATLSRRHPGHPFASVMPYALDEQGRPLMLVSTMAMHTQNLGADPRASLLVTQATGGDPLAAGRVTIMGEAHPVAAGERAEARVAYLARHANASYWVDFDDFGFWRIDLSDVYFVGGFGAMDWLSAADYAAAQPDPLAEAEQGILQHMNADHADSLLAYAHAAGAADAQEATMLSVDRLGFRLRLRTGERVHGVRIPFPREVTSAAACREVLIAMRRGQAPAPPHK
jgi:putative heme iron utilization protein